VRRRGIRPIVGWFGKLVPWFVAWAPVSLVLGQVLTQPLVPDSDVPIWAHRGSNTSVLITGVLGFMWMLDEKDTGITQRQRGILTAVSGVFLVVAGIQNRGGLIAAIAGLALIYWFARSGQRHFVGVISTVVIIVGLIFAVADIRVSFFSNSREISAEQLVENLVSVVNPDAVATSGDLVGNSSWRMDLWSAVFRDVNFHAPFLGRGYGVSLGELYGFEGAGETELRNAHNSHMTIFARSGYLGVGLWFAMFRDVGDLVHPDDPVETCARGPRPPRRGRGRSCSHGRRSGGVGECSFRSFHRGPPGVGVDMVDLRAGVGFDDPEPTRQADRRLATDGTISCLRGGYSMSSRSVTDGPWRAGRPLVGVEQVRDRMLPAQGVLDTGPSRLGHGLTSFRIVEELVENHCELRCVSRGDGRNRILG
jgi:hypothetical protein